MSWTAIVVALIQLLGPLLAEWLQAKLHEKAAEFDKRGLATVGKEPDSAALLRAVRDDLWFWQVRRKAYIDAHLKHTPAAFSGRVPYTAESRAEVLAATAA